MKKMFCALMTLCIITVIAIPQNANATKSHSINLHCTDIGNHQTVTFVSADNALIYTVNTYACASALHEAETPKAMRYTAPKLIKQSQYFNNSYACANCVLNANWRSQHRITSYDHIS
jgi:hypothetical protein